MVQYHKNYITLIAGLCFSPKCWCLTYPIQNKSKQNLTATVDCFHASVDENKALCLANFLMNFNEYVIVFSQTRIHHTI